MRRDMETKKAPLQRSQLLYVAGVVAVWWLAKTVAAIASKRLMSGGEGALKSTNASPSGFWDLRWVELAALQHLVGGVLAIIWLKVTGKGVWPTQVRGHALLVCLAALGNVVGNCAANVAYTLHTSSTSQVVKACEPLFTFSLTLLLLNSQANLDLSSLLSVVVIVVGAGGFLMGDDAVFSMWGMMAAILSNIAFPTRNVLLKRLSEVWDSPVQKFGVVSVLSVLFLLPLWLVKVVFVSGFSITAGGRSGFVDSLISSFFHSTYNLASLTVLESLHPVTHAILNISKRLFVGTASLLYYQLPFTVTMFVSLLVLILGCYLYQARNTSTSKWTMLKCLLVVAFLVFIFLPVPGLRKEGSSSATPGRPGSPTVAVPPKEVSTPVGGVPDLRNYPLSVNSKPRCSSESQLISTAWIYDKPIPGNIVENIETLAIRNPNRTVVVYCGTTQCLEAIAKLEHAYVRVEFATLRGLFKDTPLEQWLLRHAFNKVLAFGKFESNLQDAVKVGLLWRFGGFYISPTIRVLDSLNALPCEGGRAGWVSSMEDPLDLAYFSMNHPFLERLARSFVDAYPKKATKLHPFNFDFKALLRGLLKGKESCADCPTTVSVTTTNSTEALRLERLTPDMTGLKSRHFGTLAFNSRVHSVSVANLGDEIQDFPGLEYVPFVDHFVERDRLYAARDGGPMTVFFNAWWGGSGSSWPAPDNINPIMLSVHVDGGSLSSNRVAFLKKNQPIGCRDSSTLRLMTKNNLRAFFSGCMTLLISNPNLASVPREDKIYLVDLKAKYKNMLPEAIRNRSISIQHNLGGSGRLDSLNRFSESYELMEKYGRAKLVITQRIHCSLPCVAMGTPVIFFNSAGMPGGGGSKTGGSSRISGLTPLFHSVDLYKMSEAEAQAWLDNFNWDHPPPNPNVGMSMRLRAAFWDEIRKRPSMQDAAKKFGAIPMSPLPFTPQTPERLVFHLVVTSDQLDAEGRLGWRHWRCLEAILYHHPTSQVLVYANTLPRDTFSMLFESGYSVTVQDYNLQEMLRDSPAQKLVVSRTGPGGAAEWMRHEAELVGLLALYRQGGVYLDSDLILTRPIHTLPSNTLVWADQANTSINTFFMRFQSAHPFLQYCLTQLQKLGVATIGRDLVTGAWSGWDKTRKDLQVLSHGAVYELQSAESVQQCLSASLGDALMKTVTEVAYGVWLNSDLWSSEEAALEKMSGTLCGHVLNTFCVLCNRLH